MRNPSRKVEDRLQEKLEQLKSRHRYRTLRLPGGVDFLSNDYLGLCDHPALKQAALEVIESGISAGAGASRLLRGHHKEHQDLEDYAASHYGAGKALYFANGFTANYALFTTLPERRDVILYDSLIHASARDGIYACTARSVKIAHNDLNAYEDALKRFHGQAGQIWIAVESLYSMDGDFAPLKGLYDLACRYDAMLIVDEAHATGVWGKGGKGLCYDLLSFSLPQNLITLHTCGKALGVAGGLICAETNVIDYMINAARPFIYSTAPPPLQACLTQRAIEISASEEGQKRRAYLHSLCAQTQTELGGSGSQIVPVILGSDERALNAARMLQGAGYDIRAIRPPTVPEGTARLRLSLNVNLTQEVLTDFLSIVRSVLLEQAA